MLIWMQHPTHGKMPCYDRLTVDNNKKRGWSIVDDKPTQTEEPKPKRAKK